MTYKVLIVDDSHFFQSRLKKIINEHPLLDVIAIASNGLEAIAKEEQHKPDIITMDYEMPGMDGITALKSILAKRSVPILMFSSMTYEGASITLDALDAGAVDYIPKNFSEVTQDSFRLKSLLHEKLITFAKKFSKSIQVEKQRQQPSISSANTNNLLSQNDIQNLKGQIKVLVIGASTGGPIAIAEVITRLPETFSMPIIIAQHMPASFTPAFAQRLNKLSALTVKEAQHNDDPKRGYVYIAPGGMQTMIDRSTRKIVIVAGDDRVVYKPSVDILFGSAANAYGKSVLGLVLTGMGKDGYDGAKVIRANGGFIWSQDKATSVIYGMPGAVYEGKLSQHSLPLKSIYKQLTGIQ